MSLRFKSWLAACALLATVNGTQLASAADLLIPGNGTGTAPNYTTIQAAVTAAVDGDVVHITAAGTYDEAVTITNKNIRLVGDVPNVVIGQTVTSDGTSSVSLANFTRTGGNDGVVQSAGGPMVIDNLTITGAGIRGIFHGSGTEMIIRNTISNNSAFDGYTCNSNGAIVTIENCEFSDNSRAGFFFEGPAGAAMTATISGSLFKDNHDNNVGLIRTFNATVTDCQFESTVATNFVHFRFDNQDNPVQSVVAFSGCSFTGETQNGAIWLIHRANVTISNCLFDNCFRGVGVDSFGRGSNVNISGSTFNGCTFSALAAGQQSNVTINNCEFNGNEHVFGHGGEQVGASGVSIVTISNTDVTSSTGDTFAATGNTTLQASFNLTNVRVTEGQDSVFSSSGSDASPVSVFNADQCTFIDGTGGVEDLISLASANATITNSLLDGGQRQVVTNGSTAWGKLTNCTLVSGDGAAQYGFLAQTTNAGNAVINCILDGQQIGLGGNLGVTALTNHHNIIRATTNFERITPGANNQLNVDPLFIAASTGPGTGDFHLQSGSPAVNAGDASVGLTQDIEGYGRGAQIDIGAYELHVNAAKYWSAY